MKLPTNCLTVGQRINVPHGTGVIVGFERFRPDGLSAPMAEDFFGSERVIVKLDPGHTWKSLGDRELYATYPHEVAKLNDIEPESDNG